jgi:hypothetical protein
MFQGWPNNWNAGTLERDPHGALGRIRDWNLTSVFTALGTASVMFWPASDAIYSFKTILHASILPYKHS